MVVVAVDRTDPCQDYAVADALFFHHALKAEEQIGFVFETQDDGALELSSDGVGFWDGLTVGFSILGRGGGTSHFYAGGRG